MEPLTNTDAAVEFADQGTPTPVIALTPDRTVELAAENEELTTTVTSLKAQLDQAQGASAVLAKLQEALGNTSDTALTEKQRAIRKELEVITPELADVARIKQVLPMIADILDTQAKQAQRSTVGMAQDLTRELMAKDGLDATDEDRYDIVEKTVAATIRTDPKLAKLWAEGNQKAAISRGYAKVSEKLFAPLRAASKRNAVQAIDRGPRGVRGEAPVASKSADGTTLDFKDTSRAGVAKVNDAAWSRLQELMDQ